MHTSFDGVDFLGIKDLSNKETEANVVQYRYNGQQVHVLISTTPPEGCEREGALELAWIDRLYDLSSHFDGDHARLMKQFEGEREIAGEIRDAVFPTLQRLAPSPAPAADPAPSTVAEYLFPHRIRLELVTKNGKLEVLSGHHRELDRARLVVPWSAMSEIGFEPGSVTAFDAKDVVLGSGLVGGPSPADVYDVTVPGIDEKVICKIVFNLDAFQQALRREMEIYEKLNRLSLDPETRVPEFKGLITHGDGVVGFIIAKIPAKYPSLDPIVTGTFDGELPAPALRRKWAAQIEHTVKELHRHGVVWGDAKPDNVVVDMDDNAWVLDFGGGGTPGWMEPSMFQTKEGDLHAVAKMKDGLLRVGVE